MNPRFALAASFLLILAGVRSDAATITYAFTGGSLTPTMSDVPAGVTVSNLGTGSLVLTDNGSGPDSIRFFATDVGTSSATALGAANQYLRFSVTIAAGTVVNLTSLALDYTSTVPLANISNTRVFSSIDGFDQVAEDTIGTLGKAAGATLGPATSIMSLSAPEGNAGRGTNVTNGEFTALTNTTVTFYMPWIDNETGATYTDVDNLVLTFAVVPEPSTMALCGLGLLGLLRRKRA